MALLATLRGTLEPDDRPQPGRRARCRNCGRYYGADRTTCPDCGSGNRLLGGPPDCSHDRA